MSLVHPQNAAALESLQRKYYFPVLERAFQTCRDAHGLPAAAALSRAPDAVFIDESFTQESAGRSMA